MASDSQWALQQAVHTALTGDATLKTLIGDPARVYDHVPQDTAFPYVVIGEATSIPGEAEAKGQDMFEQTLTIHTWSEYWGFSEVKRIMTAIVDVLDRASLSVAGYTLLEIKFEFSDVSLDPDQITKHGVQRFRATTEPA